MRKSLQLLLLAVFFIQIGANGQERKTLCFNNDWEFYLGDIDIATIADSSWEKVNIPHTWNNRDIQSGEKVHYGTAWYRKNFLMEEVKKEKKFFLRFEGVGQYAELYINDKYVGKHLGAFSAFVFDITSFLLPDTNNMISVKVNNELANSYPKDNFLFGIYGGIYRDVNLIETEELHIGLCDNASNGVFVYQDDISKEKAVLKIIVQVNNETSVRKSVIIKNKLLDKNHNTVAENTIREEVFPGGLKPYSMSLQLDEPILWNGRKNPYLYTLETEIIYNEKVMDKVTQNIGLRFYEIDPEKGFILNGEAYRLYGVCRHQEWEDMGNALLPEHHRKDMELINEMGATSVRLAHYQQSEYIYDLADSLGLLIWAEIPFVNGYKENADDNAKQQLTELIKQNFNHPSIFVWGVHNEVIKGGVVQQPVQLTKELHHISKTLDPSRYTVSVSNIWWIYNHPIHENTDLQGFNQYTGWYGGKPDEIENWILAYHKSKPDIRFSISEYGAGGNILQQSNNDSIPPKPTAQFFPEGYQTHYHEVVYSSIEKHPYIWASYVWNMFDFSVPEWDRGGIKGRNHKGLVSYDRKTKKDAFYWYKANWSEEAVLHLTGKRNNNIDINDYKCKAYCNFDTPRLFINGKDYGDMKAGINSVQFVSPLLHLKNGEYTIMIKANDKGNVRIDEYQLVVGGNSNR